MKKTLKATFGTWLPLSVATIIVYGFMYLIIQQYIRLSTNEAPLQYAEDTRSKLENGVSASLAISGIAAVNMQKSLATFVMIFDKAGALQASSATMDGIVPAPPKGILDNAAKNGENRVTWQPKPGVRNATVILPYTMNGQDGFVLAGRSMREIEKREQFALYQIMAGTIITLAGTFFVCLFIQFRKIINQ